MGGTPNPVRDGFYTISSRDHNADDELLEAVHPQATPAAALVVDESKYFEALMAVTDQAGSLYGPASHGSPQRNSCDACVAGHGVPPKFTKHPPRMHSNNRRERPSANP